MALFKSRKNKADSAATNGHEKHQEQHLSQSQVKRATRTRTIWSIVSSVLLALTVIFLIVVEVGDTSSSNGSSNIYFIYLNLQNVVPQSFGSDAALLNSIAQTLGLHDFYTVGLWGYCEGYIAQGVTSCTKPQTLYWFNPVEIIKSQLLAGASIQLPDDITKVLDIIKLASQVMFGFFLSGACFSFVLIFLKPFEKFSRWISFAIAFLGFLNTVLVLIATVIATVLFVIMEKVFNGNTTVNIEASLGKTMFAMMYIASVFALTSWIIDLCLMCCCASRRDVRTGRKRGNKKAYDV